MARDAITFSVGTEDAESVAAFLRLAKAERELEVQTRRGNVAMGERAQRQRSATAEVERAAAVEARAAVHAARAVELERERAAASLAAQRSRALQAKMEEDASRRVRMARGWESAAARAQFEADGRNHERVMRRQRELAEGLQGTGSAAVGAAGRIANLAVTFRGLIAAGGVVGGVLAGLEKQFDELMQKSERANAQARAMKDFVAAVPPGAEGEEFLKETLARGVRYGVGPEGTAALAGPLMAASDVDGDGRLRGRELGNFKGNLVGGLMMQSAGVSAEDSTNWVLAAQSRGVSGIRAASELMKTSEISMRGPDVFAKSASAIAQFDKMDEGLAVTAALTKTEFNQGRIPERVKDVQLALSSAQDSGEFAKTHGLAGLSTWEKLSKLRKVAVESGNVKAYTDQFKSQGLDEGKAISLAMLVQQGDFAQDTLSTLRTMPPGFAKEKVRQLEQATITSNAMAQEKGVAAFKYQDLYGPGSGEARTAFKRELALGNQLQAYGGDQAVDPETGLPKPWGVRQPGNTWDRAVGTVKAVVRGMPIFNAGLDSAPNAGAATANLVRTQESLLRALERNNELLERNNSATEDNSSVLERQPAAAAAPVGGAVGNREERY